MPAPRRHPARWNDLRISVRAPPVLATVEKSVLARRQNQHARRVRSPEELRGRFLIREPNVRAGISLGGNLGDRLACLTNARDAIFALPEVHPPLLSSSLYETDPVDCEAGAPKFLNAIIEIGHEGASPDLLGELQR